MNESLVVPIGNQTAIATQAQMQTLVAVGIVCLALALILYIYKVIEAKKVKQ